MKKISIITSLALAWLFLVTSQSSVHAHAILLGSSPEANQVLDESPEELVLNFNENVGPIFFKVLNTKGEEVGNPDDPRVVGNDMLMTLKDDLPDGTYVMTYRVVSADTHPVGASFVFSVGEPHCRHIQYGYVRPIGKKRLVAAGRHQSVCFFNTSVLFAVGGALFTLLMTTPDTITNTTFTIGRTASLLAGLSFLASLGFGGSEMLMGGPLSIFSFGDLADRRRHHVGAQRP